MEIKFNIPDKYKKEKLFLCSVENPSPILYVNIYGEGDVWIKVKGCEGCKEHKKCCGNCPLSIDLGCAYHLGANKKGSKKPFFCIYFPIPDNCLSWCQLEFKCIVGKYKNKIRKIKKHGNIFNKEQE